MIELFQIWMLVEVLGLLCLPLTVTVFHNLPDRGWNFSKAIGITLLAFCVWFPLICLRFLPFSQFFILGVALILVAANLLGFLYVRHTIVKVVRLNKAYVVLSELIFLGMVFLLGWLRSYGPEIRSYEMFMDEGFIAAIMRSPHLPPNDMWFAGYPINYYYYAHFTIAVLAKLLGQSPSIIFNTGISIFFGLTAANLFGVTCNIVAWARYQRVGKSLSQISSEGSGTLHAPLLPGVPYGILAMVMALILGNLAATQQWWLNHGEGSQFNWFAPSRVIDKTINEFPAFSFLLACFHAHVLALAFTILGIALALNIFLELDGKGLYAFGRGWRLPLTLMVTALVLGGLFTMNGWDYPTYMGLTLVCITLQQWLAYNTRVNLFLALDIIVASVSLLAISFLLYIPFYLHFISPSQGIGIVLAADRSPLRAVVLIYGLFAFVFVSLLFASAMKRPLPRRFTTDSAAADDKSWQDSRRFDWSRLAVVSAIAFLILLGIAFILMQNGMTFVIVASLAVLSVVVMFYHIGDRGHAFTLLLGTLAFALIALCEVFYLKDVFASNYPRMNTVFKFYFQSWALLSVACGAGLFFILESFRPQITGAIQQRWLQRAVAGLWGSALVGLLVAGAVYPIAAPQARYARTDASGQNYSLQRSNSLDGLSYLQNDPANPGDYAAIRWLNANVQGDPVIIEAIGDDYTNYGRVSAFTGLPTLMGWVGHEYQWRVNWLRQGNNQLEFERRSADVDLIYNSPNPSDVLAIMKRYQAQYLYIGPLEYLKYPKTDLRRFATFMQIVYNANGVVIYKIK